MTERPAEPDDDGRPRSGLATGWALLGVAAIFAWSVYSLGGRGLEAVRGGLDPFQWAALVVFTVGFVYTEGILTFDRRWIPKLVRRSRRVRHESTAMKLLAPLYGLALVGHEWKTVVKAWIGTALIVTAVVIIREFPPPWRGIVDFAVAAAMAWGLVSIAREIPAAVRPDDRRGRESQN